MTLCGGVGQRGEKLVGEKQNHKNDKMHGEVFIKKII